MCDNLGNAFSVARMRVGDATAPRVIPISACFHSRISVNYYTVFQRHKHRYDFHYRTRFIAEECMIHTFYVIGARPVKVKIGHRLYLSCRDFHHNGSSPFRLRFLAHVIEFLLHNVLYANVDGSNYVVAIDCRHMFPSEGADCRLDSAFFPVFSIQQRVESLFKPRRAMHHSRIGMYRTDTS